VMENPKTSAYQILGKMESKGMDLRGRMHEYVRQIRAAMHATNQP
jgi:hypothetical protein